MQGVCRNGKITIIIIAMCFSLMTMVGGPVDSAASPTTRQVPSSARSRAAISRVTPGLKTTLEKKGYSWGTPIFIRLFKESKKLEVWLAKGARYSLFKIYDICTYGGGALGPKEKYGDGRAPEGFYYVTPCQMNPYSNFHLSFNLGYPNKYDRIHGRTGSALMVHGSCVSIGCYAMTDAGIEEIFALADAAFRGGQPFFRVHIFPFHMTENHMKRHENNKWQSFWINLKDGYDFFESRRVPPNVEVKNNQYVFEASRPPRPRTSSVYHRQASPEASQSLQKAIAPPEGYERAGAVETSFAHWLRRLPLKEQGAPVRLYNGTLKANQSAHFRVIDMDIGRKNLQQCADAVMRLRAEYLYATGHHEAIHFNFTSGDEAAFTRWAGGDRPIIRGNRVTWQTTAPYDSSYSNFKQYMEMVFTYAGTASLSREMTPRPIDQMNIGDVFIQGGSPGHAVIVIDMAVHKKNRKSLFLLAQSYMPAQEIHILKNPNNRRLSPWYDTNFGQRLYTPEWTFDRNQLKRF